jgi:PAS domain S-box-containing protein
MTTWTQTLAKLPNYGADSATTLALRLAHAENALHALTSGQVDAIVDPSGKAYLLRPAQEQLRQNETRLKALIDSIADVITVVNRGGTIVSQSLAVTRVFGFGPEELLGKNIFEFINFEDRAHVYSAFFSVIEGLLEDATVIFRQRTADESFQTVEATIRKLNEAAVTSVVLSMRPVPGCLFQGAEADWHPGKPETWELATNGSGARKDGTSSVMD